MTIAMTIQEQIRRLDAAGVSGRQIAKDLGISRDSVSKYLDVKDFSPKPPVVNRRPGASVLTELTSVIDGWLTEDAGRPRKQRHTAKRVFDRLADEHGYAGSYSPVQRYVKAYQAARRSAAQGYSELTWSPGVAQVDFGQAQAVIAGVMQVLHILVVTFPFSNMRYAQAYPTRYRPPPTSPEGPRIARRQSQLSVDHTLCAHIRQESLRGLEVSVVVQNDQAAVGSRRADKQIDDGQGPRRAHSGQPVLGGFDPSPYRLRDRNIRIQIAEGLVHLVEFDHIARRSSELCALRFATADRAAQQWHRPGFRVPRFPLDPPDRRGVGKVVDQLPAAFSSARTVRQPS